MQVKKFEAPTIQEALDTIKRELGPEAIILSTKKYKRGFGLMSKASVEVTAAVSDRSLHKKGFVDSRLPEGSREQVKKLPAERQADVYDKYLDQHLAKAAKTQDRVEVSSKGGVAAPRKLTATRYAEIDAPATRPSAPAQPTGQVELMQKEIQALKRLITEMQEKEEVPPASGTGAQALIQTTLNTPALADAFEQLVVNGLDRRYALALVKRAAFELDADRKTSAEAVLDQVAIEIMESIDVSSPLASLKPGQGGGPAVIAFVGPTGVGKTTTAAKIASEAALKRGLKVGLVNLDQHKAGAFDQLATYAKILNLPFRSASSIDDFRSALRDFQALDLVLVDTTGRSQRDPAAIRDMQETLNSVPGVRAQLVLSVTTRDTEMYDMASRFSVFRPSGLILSKLDESTIFGSIYNIAQRAQLPLLYFTTGQRVPEDIEESSKERVAALILEI